MQRVASLSSAGISPLHKSFCAGGDQVIKQLTWAEWGVQSSDNVVFYQHGWPGSRIGGSMLHDVAQRLNVRVIAVDRPGFGASPFTPRHTLASWATALHHLADHLKVERFSILGPSGGAPFAAACARYIPTERVAGLGLLCPLGPVTSSSAQGMAVCNAALMAIARQWPGLARTIWRVSRLWMEWDSSCMVRFTLNPQDKAAMQAAPHVAQAIRAAVLEGLAAGARGVVHEMGLAQSCWGFRLQDIQVEHAFMWHGLQDPLVPYGMAKAYESIPGCQSVYFPNETHTTIVINKLCHALEALAQLQHQSLASASFAGSTAFNAAGAAAAADVPMGADGAGLGPVLEAAAAATLGVGVGTGRMSTMVQGCLDNGCCSSSSNGSGSGSGSAGSGWLVGHVGDQQQLLHLCVGPARARCTPPCVVGATTGSASEMPSLQ